jgi:hypothetical protein
MNGAAIGNPDGWRRSVQGLTRVHSQQAFRLVSGDSVLVTANSFFNRLYAGFQITPGLKRCFFIISTYIYGHGENPILDK